ncbi:hypothetical protein QT979_21380 [Microcoleus sp. w2-18bC1]|uniref:hypothetical protein n=1 Tax=unclassified Microcoleus TaxID=2642155 RepID=UPI002FD378CD
MDDLKIVGAITSAAAATGTGSVTIATITSSAPGILGVIGFTTTTTVALPVAGVVAVAGLVAFGVFKGVEMARQQSESQ